MPVSPTDATRSQLDASQFHPEFGYLAPTMRFRRKAGLTLKAATWGILLGAIVTFVVVMDREEKARTMLAAPMVSTPMVSTPMVSAPTQAAVAHKPGAVRFVPQSMAFPTAAAGRSQARGVGVMAAIAAPAAAPVTPEPPAVVATPVADAIATPSESPAVITPPVAPTAATPLHAPTAITPADVTPAADAPPATPVVTAAPVNAAVRVAAKPKKKIAPRSERVVVLEPEPPRTVFAGPFRRFAEPYAPGYDRPIFGFGW